MIVYTIHLIVFHYYIFVNLHQIISGLTKSKSLKSKPSTKSRLSFAGKYTYKYM